MGDFPPTVNTETGGSLYDNVHRRHGGQAAYRTKMNTAFIRSIPAILMLLEMVLGLLHWALIVSVPVLLMPAYGWVLFVAITLWILTIALFLVILLEGYQYMTCIPWTLTVMGFHFAAAVLYLTAFAVNAAHVDVYGLTHYYGHMAAAAAFGTLTWVAYCASAAFSFLDWKGDQGNAATNTVPT